MANEPTVADHVGADADPQFTDTHARHVETRYASSRIVDGPTLEGHYVSRRQFVADKIFAEWQRIDDGPWGLVVCKVSGPLVLKGKGALSEATRLTRYVGKLPSETQPAWVGTWLNDNGP